MTPRPPQPFHVSRRRFLQSASALAAASGLPLWYVKQSLAADPEPQPASDKDKPNIALVGCGGRGGTDIQNASRHGNVIGCCDVDAKHAANTCKKFPGAQPYSDFRKLMERKDLHVIVTGTPDHWHTLVNIHAMRQGFDVYSEKPLTLTIEEGQKLIQVRDQTNRILQTGSQQRSDPRFRLAVELVRNGRIGKLLHIDTLLPRGATGGPFEQQPVPEGLDWDFWQGQAPRVPYVPQRCHGTFRYWWEYSEGTITDWGAHHNDIALWALDLLGPTTIEGKRLDQPIPGGYTTPSQYRIEYTYANGVTHTCTSINDNPNGTPIVPETKAKTSSKKSNAKPTDSSVGPSKTTAKKANPGSNNGVRFTGTDGWIFVNRGRLEASDPSILEDPAHTTSIPWKDSSANHMANFFSSIQTRKPPIAPAEVGHRSISVCHLGAISIRLGRKLTWNPEKEEFVNDPEANAMRSRKMHEPWGYDAV